MEHDFVVISSNKEHGDASDLTISAYLKSFGGRRRLGRSMIAPIRNNIDYQSISRKCFLVQQLPTGALPIYDKDPNLTGFEHDEIIISSNNTSGAKEEGLVARRVVFPTFEIFNTPTIKLQDVKSRRFSLIDREIATFDHDAIIINSSNKSGTTEECTNIWARLFAKTKQQIMAQEDAAIFEAVDAIGSGNNDI